MKLIFSWDDENTDANTPLTKNNVSGTIPDHNFQYLAFWLIVLVLCVC